MGLESAVRRGMRVLSARAAQAEHGLSFSALADLLESVDNEVLHGLPAPQRSALEVALLRVDALGRPPEPRAIGAGTLRVLRALAAHGPLIVALDDVQWLDPGSSDAMSFAVRRLETSPVGLLLTERSGPASEFRRAVDVLDPVRTEVAGLSFGAARHLLGDRLDLHLARRSMRRVFDATRGNPLFVLELGRSIVGHETLAEDDDLPITTDIEDLIGVRIASLETPVRRALLAVALGGDLRLDQLSVMVEVSAINDAVTSGLLVVEEDRVRTAHPLLAAVVRDRASVLERRSLHGDLADSMSDHARSAHHRAMAAVGVDESLAWALADAAAAAVTRGARTDAVHLAGHALRLTAPDSPHRSERLLAVAEALDRAGEEARVQALLAPEIDALQPGPLRARGHLLLLGGAPSVAEYDHNLDQALLHSRGDPALRALALAEKTLDTVVTYVRRLPEAEAWATEAVSLSPSAAEPLAAAGWVRILMGRPVDDLVARQRSAATVPAELFYSVERLAGIRAAFRGETAVARQTFQGLLEEADDRGESSSYAALQHQLAELELRCGEIDNARRLIEEHDSTPDDGIGVIAHVPRLRALLAALAGLPEDAVRWADRASQASARIGTSPDSPDWDVLEVQRARGLIALLAGDARGAVDVFGMVWAHTEREGIDDPGAFPVAPDLVEALASQGDLLKAHETTTRLHELAERQDHPWGRASVVRCRALLQLSSKVGEGDPVRELAAAADAYAELGLRFDAARSLLLSGVAARRLRRWGAARQALARAVEAFEAIGSTGWAARGVSELERIGDRTSRTDDDLTRSERRAAELAAEGLTNREIAAALFIGEHTVEVHLSHAYAKLGIRSRAALARRLVDRP
jgi:DNA-binding CsgD family transcriptional regulator